MRTVNGEHESMRGSHLCYEVHVAKWVANCYEKYFHLGLTQFLTLYSCGGVMFF